MRSEISLISVLASGSNTITAAKKMTHRLFLLRYLNNKIHSDGSAQLKCLIFNLGFSFCLFVLSRFSDVEKTYSLHYYYLHLFLFLFILSEQEEDTGGRGGQREAAEPDHHSESRHITLLSSLMVALNQSLNQLLAL